MHHDSNTSAPTSAFPMSVAAMFTFILSGLTPEQIASTGRLGAIEALAGVARSIAALRAAVAASGVAFDGNAADTLGAIGARARSAIQTLAIFEQAAPAAPFVATITPDVARDVLLALVSTEREAEDEDGDMPGGSVPLLGIQVLALDSPGIIADRAADRAKLDRAAREDLSGVLPYEVRAARELLLALASRARDLGGETGAADAERLTAAARDGAALRSLVSTAADLTRPAAGPIAKGEERRSAKRRGGR